MLSHSKLPRTWRRLQREQRAGSRRSLRIRARAGNGGQQLDPAASARIAGLRYVNDETMPGLRRVGSANRVRYVDPSGRPVSDRAELQRIRSLAIPPAWTDVWICPSPLGHLQATGRDARGRKQYRYHARWREVRDATKFFRMVEFGEALPALRRRIARDMA